MNNFMWLLQAARAATQGPSP